MFGSREELDRGGSWKGVGVRQRLSRMYRCGGVDATALGWG